MPYPILANIGTWEWVLIALVVLLLFGSTKLPALARSLGSSITEFKKGMKGDDATKAGETPKSGDKS